MNAKDLFECLECLPSEVIEIINEFQDLLGDQDYLDCKNFIEKLESVGYTCDFGLNAEPFGLRKI